MEIRFHYDSARDALRRAGRVLLIAHKKPDGDTLGAALAFFHFCRGQQIPVDLFCADPIPRQYWYMAGSEKFSSDMAMFRRPYEAIALFDAGDVRMAGIATALKQMKKPPVILNFDHHVTNERFGTVNIVDVTASSTTEVVYRFLQYHGLALTSVVATCLLTGVMTDTGNLTNPATTESAFVTAAELLRHGGKIHEIANRLVRNKTVAMLRLWGIVLSRLKHDPTLGISSTVIFLHDIVQCRVASDSVEGIANFLGMYLDSRVVLVLREAEPHVFKGSLRTTEHIDLSLVARRLGGGGHKKACGFTVRGQIVDHPTRWAVQRR